VKRQPTEWEKIIGKPYIWQGLISRVDKELKQLNSKKEKKNLV
jgi:hypothetical protein